LRLQHALHLPTKMLNAVTNTKPRGKVAARITISAPPADFMRFLTPSQFRTTASTAESEGHIP
jgi:hypothetical protein